MNSATDPQAPALLVSQETTATSSTTSGSTVSATSSASGSKQSRRVLTVGDGNFSYSLAYAKRFLQPSPHNGANEALVELTATSYDSYDELVDKYPESARIRSQITDCGAQVLHRVDATNLKVSLENALKEANVDASSSQGLNVSKLFDVVIFNHPHCGEENVRRHQSLLSHFYASALEILSDSKDNSEIHLTLAKGQPERWEAIKRARLAGLVLKQQVDDVDSHELYGLEYERKRHQNGKSFHRVLLHGEKLQQQSTLFIFARRDQASQDESLATKPQSPVEIASTADSPAVATAPSRKRKARDAALRQPLAFACTDCEKSFKTAQGLKTHVHMVHELGQVSAAGAAAPALLLPCGFCERTFKNEDAQRQHRLAKHGEDQLILPDWYEKQQELLQTQDPESGHGAAETTLENAEPQKEQLTCSICHFVFPSQTVFDEHWQNLKPKEVVLRNCSHCGRVFDEERALRQHQNFCKAPQQQPEDK